MEEIDEHIADACERLVVRFGPWHTPPVASRNNASKVMSEVTTAARTINRAIVAVLYPLVDVRA